MPQELTLDVSKLPRTYLFIAEYDDGTLYRQTSDDKSIQEEGKNAFYDIKYKPWKPLAELKRFHLARVGGGAPSLFTVDLRDGHFEVNGASFFLTEFPEESELELHYSRRHAIAPGESVPHLTIYRLGWKKKDGTERILEIL